MPRYLLRYAVTCTTASNLVLAQGVHGRVYITSSPYIRQELSCSCRHFWMAVALTQDKHHCVLVLTASADADESWCMCKGDDSECMYLSQCCQAAIHTKQKGDSSTKLAHSPDSDPVLIQDTPVLLQSLQPCRALMQRYSALSAVTVVYSNSGWHCVAV